MGKTASIFPVGPIRNAGRAGAALLVLFSFSPAHSQPLQRSDAAQIQADLESSLQDKLDTLIGPRRSIVNVNVTLIDQFAGRDAQAARALERHPGIRVKVPDEQAAISSANRGDISSLHIIIDADDTLPEEDLGAAPEYNGRIREAVSRWSRLNPARGDTLKVNPMEWGDHAPPSAAQQNYVLYSILALVALLILIAAIYFPMRKLKGTAPAAAMAGGAGETGALAVGGAAALSEEDRRSERKSEMEAMRDMLSGVGSTGDATETTLTAIRELMEQQLAGGARNDTGLLEEIRDLLGNPPQESDALLTEMRDTLSDMLDEQRKIAARAGIAAGAPGAAAAAAAAAGPAGGPTGEGGVDDAMGAEIVEALETLEELMSQQLEKTPDKEGIDQPFKYLKSTDPEDIILLISDEEPKLAAAVLSQIDPKTAAAVFEALEDNKQFELARAMTQLTEEEDMAEEIKDFLERKLKIVRLHKDYQPVTGVRVLADILSTSRYAVARVMLDKMEGKNPAMAAEVRKRMFLFEDIQTLQDKDVEIIIHNLSPELLAYALTDTDEETRAKFLKNMTEKAREMVREDMESVKKVQLEEEGKELPFNQALLGVDQNIIDEIFRTVDRTTLKMALRGASEQVQEKFFSGLTERAVAMLREDLEVMGGISRDRADEAQEEIMNILRQLSSKNLSAQHEIIATIRKLEHEGQITVARFREETV
ncbi:MAG: FliG C-terminal domain-containing protein [PVC group bacterium]